MDLSTLEIFLMVVVALGGLFFKLVGNIAFYGCKIYLLFKNDKESKVEKRRKKKQSLKE
ncbi:MULTISPECIES: hypothetical protein [Bacillus cereus group]|uniref:hypothetical protein n=1 Tax=Bacillus cereus group TaxID=86661 RepID=UPI0015E40894|nr:MULTISPECIES: hypothetical protein [Bacillus cereus group]HDR6295693.1 hypothetical protein [Bacillus cereus]HDR7806980.1 hypothetical protein [Bacillus cereus]